MDLSRKLVDRYDLTYVEDSIESSIDSYTKDYYGAGVAQTPEFPNGLVVTLSNLTMGGSVAAGVAFDAAGNRIPVAAPTAFSIPASSPTFPRWDLLVLRYKKLGNTLVPKPSDPILSVYLNLIDSYDLIYLTGTPAAIPAYPATLTNDVILDGIKVGVGASVGTDCDLDDTVRMYAVPPASRLLRAYKLGGVSDGTNNHFILPQAPCDPHSVALLIDGTPVDDGAFQNIGIDIFITDPTWIPQAGQEVHAIILIGQTGAMAQAANTIPSGKLKVETLIGVVDGVNDSFQLSEIPIDPTSVVVLINGIVRATNEYSITGQTVTFASGNIPPLGSVPGGIYLIGSTAIVATVMMSSGDALYHPFGTKGAPLTINPVATMMVSADDRQMRFIALSGGSGAVAMSSVPQIAAGSNIGQELLLKGTSSSDYPIFHDGDGLELNGPWNGSQGKSLTLVWDGVVWSENGRK